MIEGNTNAQELPDPSTWVLHLKKTTPLNMEALKTLSTASTTSQEFLSEALKFLTPERFYNLFTSRTIKATAISAEDILKAVEMGKFEPCDPDVIKGPTLPIDVHGVNVFTTPELKGRRRLITEPHLNGAIAKHEVPRVQYNTRLARRQSLRYAKYMLQIDFEAYYDSIPIPENIRNNFVFRTKSWKYYRLRTLPTGARWSVAVGQAITNVIIDIDTPIIIETLIDNIMLAAKEGQEKEFIHGVRTILTRIKTVNLMTSPDRESILSMPDDEILKLAQDKNIFLGEEYREWNGKERLVRNSSKTIAKLQLALEINLHTHRTFASTVSLILFALHTTQINPAKAFRLLQAYRGVYQMATTALDWDTPLPYLHSKVKENLDEIGEELCKNEWWTIAEIRRPTYNDLEYDIICYTDASAAGWGAIVQCVKEKKVKTYQQKWIPNIHLADIGAPGSTLDHFNAKHSAHAEPRAVHTLLKQLVKEGICDNAKIAIVTDHFPIAHAQKRLNGYGGIGRGYALNTLFEYTYDLLYKRNIQVVYFYLTGRLNPADELSRHFGGTVRSRNIIVKDADDMGLPPLLGTRSPLCDEYLTGHTRPEKETIEEWNGVTS